MTDKNQEQDGQKIVRPPEDPSAKSPDEAAVPDESAESQEKTLEVPQVDAEPQAPAQTEPIAPPVDSEATKQTQPTIAWEPAGDEPTAETPAVSTPEPVQPTAVMPTVSPPPESAAEDTAPTDAVPPPVADTPASSGTEDSADDTSDFTLSDVTFSDADSGGMKAWLLDLRTRLTPGHGAGGTSSPKSPTAKSKHRRLRPWQWAAIGVGTLVLLFAVFVAVDGTLYYSKVHHGIQVDGQDVSRLTSAEATELLTELADEAQNRAITLVGDEQSWTVLPVDLGAVIDVTTAVSEAMALTRDGNVVVDLGDKIALYFRSRDIPLHGTVDDDKMDLLLTTVAETLDAPAVNATLEVVDGEIEIVEGTEGLVVDKEALRTSLTELLLSFHSTELTIPMVVASPDLSAVDVEDALAEAKVMISADVELTYQGETIATVTPDQLIGYLAVEHVTEDGEPKTAPILSADKMMALLDTVDPQVGTPAVDATFEMDLEGEEPYPLVVVPGEDGEGLDREETAAALTQAAMSPTSRTAEVVLQPISPERTTEDLEAMGIKDLLGDYKTSPYVGTKNRQQNVRLATSLCSGVFLAPGEEFNTDVQLGVRNAANGWATAPGIVGPGKLEDVYGGGICQVSTTLFNAVLLAGLEITERHNHSIFINHYPNGRDATVTAGGKNMRFRNDTDHYIFIYGWSTGINTRFWVWGVNDGRQVQPIRFSGFSFGARYTTETVINKSLPVGSTEQVFSGQTARKCSIERTIVYPDGTTDTESFSSYYPMMPKVIETNPAPTTTSPPSTAGPTSTSSTSSSVPAP